MQIFLREAVGIAQGDEVLFSDYANGGDMWTGTGTRERCKRIAFTPAFRAPPVVHVGLSLWDIDATTNARMDVTAENVTAQGFDIVFRTWGDTRVARVRVRWMAIGPVPHADDWHDIE